MMEFSLAAAKVEREYDLKCKVYIKRKWFEDEDSKGNRFNDYTDQVILVPLESKDQVLFFDAWLPSYEEETYECAGILLHPINKPCRLGIRQADQDSEYPHLLMLSAELDDLFKRFVEDQGKKRAPEIHLTILPASEEENFDV